MEHLETFQTLLEVIALILTISSQYPLLGIVAAIGTIICLLNANNNDV